MMITKIREWLWSFLSDDCEVCGGFKGGVRGNENIIDGVVMCDYCHAEQMNPTAFWPLAQYRLVRLMDQTSPVGPFQPGHSYLLLGEIQQMPGHCVVVVDKKIVCGWHTDNFIDLTDEESDDYMPG